ncbi:unnamed protein product, partial [Ectocarpus sp. 13 AM-2016]
ESEALLSVLRPYCMSAVLAMEDLLNSGRNLASASAAAANASQRSSSVFSSDADAAHVAAVRRLKASLASLQSALAALVPSPSISPPSPSPAPSEVVRRAFPAALPFVMLPLELALAPPDRRNAGESRTSGLGGAQSPEVPAGAREKAFLCVAEAVRASGSRFVEGYGVKPTIHVMIRLVFTLSECSPANGGVLAGSSSGSAVSGAVRNGPGRVEGSGLTAGIDALRLSCLKCLEAVLRAPFACEWHHSSSSSSSSSSNDSQWSEVRNDLKDAIGGGILAQLVQELLLCCQQGEESSPPAANGAGATRRAVAASPGSGGDGRAR